MKQAQPIAAEADSYQRLYGQIQSLQDDQAVQLLQHSNPGELFLHTLFFGHQTLSDEARMAVLQHVDCPDSVLLFCLAYLPEWSENSPALALKQLDQMTDTRQVPWDRLVRYFGTSSRRNAITHKLVRLHDPHWSRKGADVELGRSYLHVEIEPRSRSHILLQTHIMLAMTASRVLGAVLDVGDKYDLHYLAHARDERIHDLMVEHENFRVRLALVNNLHLSPATIAKLIADRTASVRKKVATHKNQTLESVQALLALNEDAVTGALAANPSLSRQMQAVVRDARECHAASGDGHPDVRAALAMLRDAEPAAGLLTTLARHPQPVVRCAAAHHPAATREVYAIIRDDPVPWVLAPLAGKTRDADFMAALANTDCADVLHHLANNPELPADIAVRLLQRGVDDQTRLGIAAIHVDNAEVMAALQQTSCGSVEWEQNLALALNPATKNKQLSKLYYDWSISELCISRAIARHERCPPKVLAVFGQHLPADAMANPANAMTALEGRAIPARGFSDYSQVTQINAHTFLAHAAFERDAIEVKRQLASCPSAHSCYVDRLALIDDDSTQKRLTARGDLSRYLLEVLSFSQRLPVRKALLKQAQLPDELLLRLCDDSEESLRLAAGRLAKKRRLAHAAAKPRARAAKGLGNKAARLELAANSRARDILEQLCNDKLAAVRQAVATRKVLSEDQLLGLCRDADHAVCETALQTIVEKKLSAGGADAVQQILATLLVAADTDRSFKYWILDHIEDERTIGRAYLQGALRAFEHVVVRRTRSAEVLDKILFEYSRSKDGRHSYVEVLQNPALTRAQAQQILASTPLRLADLQQHVQDPELLASLSEP